MNTKEINANIIAPFMGITPMKDISKHDGSVYYYYNNFEEQDFDALPDYVSDYHELMLVVDKIEIELGHAFEICQTHVDIYAHDSESSLDIIIDVDEETKKKAIYSACVKFINWYNQQKK